MSINTSENRASRSVPGFPNTWVRAFADVNKFLPQDFFGIQVFVSNAMYSSLEQREVRWTDIGSFKPSQDQFSELMAEIERFHRAVGVQGELSYETFTRMWPSRSTDHLLPTANTLLRWGDPVLSLSMDAHRISRNEISPYMLDSYFNEDSNRDKVTFLGRLYRAAVMGLQTQGSLDAARRRIADFPKRLRFNKEHPESRVYFFEEGFLDEVHENMYKEVIKEAKRIELDRGIKIPEFVSDAFKDEPHGFDPLPVD